MELWLQLVAGEQISATSRPLQPPVYCIRCCFNSCKVAGAQLTSDLHLALRLRMSGAVYSLPHIPSRHAHGLLYALLLTVNGVCLIIVV